MAVATHGMKFAYSYIVALAFALTAVGKPLELNPLGAAQRSSDGLRGATRFEIAAACLRNVLNEGKPFTLVYVLGVLGLLSIPPITDEDYWPRAGVAAVALLPVLVVFYRFVFPMELWTVFCVALGIFLAAFRFVDVTALVLVLRLYLPFAVLLWGTINDHLHIGTPWTNLTRFWPLVLENHDPTGGNFLERIPMTPLPLLAFLLMVDRPGLNTVVAVEWFVLGLGAVALPVPYWFPSWPPPPLLTPTRLVAEQGQLRRKDSSPSSFVAAGPTPCRRWTPRSLTVSAVMEWTTSTRRSCPLAQCDRGQLHVHWRAAQGPRNAQ